MFAGEERKRGDSGKVSEYKAAPKLGAQHGGTEKETAYRAQKSRSVTMSTLSHSSYSANNKRC